MTNKEFAEACVSFLEKNPTLLTKEDVLSLTTTENFGGFFILKKITTSADVDRFVNGSSRYYSNITIKLYDEEYLITSEWYWDSASKNRPRFAHWLIDKAKRNGISEADIPQKILDGQIVRGESPIPETQVQDTEQNEQQEDAKEICYSKIFFGAPGTGKSFKVNSILGEERKKCFAESSEIAKSNHYADVLSNEEYIDCNIWIIDNIGTIEKKLAEFDLDDKRANPRHSALQAYIDFLKKYREENRELRTTFHPDYDYAQFVGAYKPKKDQISDNGLLSEGQLAQKLSDFFPKNDGEEIDKTTAITLFGLKYANSLNGKNMNEIVRLSGIGNDQYKSAYMSAAMKARLHLQNFENKITYSFVPQVFAKAYAAAWKLQLTDAAEANVFLVIEEINRGNCAQIFGDVFQLLDRDSDGFSQYSIDADCDFAEWLEKEFTAANLWDAYKKKVGGEGKLKLPPNLNILATMNTSDQSLFPMDSAFKRRFDWEYVPIKYAKDSDCGENWNANKFEIEIGESKYKWLDFLEKVNADIYEVTRSEDKQMGEFFIKPKDGKKILFEDFRSKVLFYLWDSVYKDETERQTVFHFAYENGDDKIKSVTFQSLFGRNDKEIVNKIMENLKVEKVTTT